MLENDVRKNLIQNIENTDLHKFMAWKGKVMEFIPYCSEKVFRFCFYQIPKELFPKEYYKGKLSLDEIILYGLLLDRLSVYYVLLYFFYMNS
jgi:hypothetical protein